MVVAPEIVMTLSPFVEVQTAGDGACHPGLLCSVNDHGGSVTLLDALRQQHLSSLA